MTTPIADEVLREMAADASPPIDMSPWDYPTLFRTQRTALAKELLAARAALRAIAARCYSQRDNVEPERFCYATATACLPEAGRG